MIQFWDHLVEKWLSAACRPSGYKFHTQTKSLGPRTQREFTYGQFYLTTVDLYTKETLITNEYKIDHFLHHFKKYHIRPIFNTEGRSSKGPYSKKVLKHGHLHFDTSKL